MPCYFPLQATFSRREDGKKDIKFSDSAARLFQKGIKPLGDNHLQIPCGRCMGCRLERSRQWATRMVHEAKFHESNCFLTLTISPEHIDKICPNLGAGYSLVKKHVQDFIKRLRRRFDDQKIRIFYCGEYGENLGRPHYHICVFGFDFSDKVKWKRVEGNWYYISKILDSLWPYGFCTIGEFTFETAAYVARYCTKKITGSQAEDHYQGRLPEFCGMSTKPGIGKAWFDRYGKTDVIPHDSVVSRGVECSVPKYYDKLWDREDPEGFAKAKEARRLRGEKKEDDATFARLADRLKCQEARVQKLIRKLEKN